MMMMVMMMVMMMMTMIMMMMMMLLLLLMMITIQECSRGQVRVQYIRVGVRCPRAGTSGLGYYTVHSTQYTGMSYLS